ncbi:MAG TPA: ABC transporter ATP-binding protein [Solirubrobacterales bacterium]|nr:ABC transporter ATP-binding protein [Solirubrobacterales bacterium]
MLEVVDAIGGYGDIRVLNGISLRLEAAEITTVLGPNGSGKSTLMKAIAGFVRLTSGRVLVDGEEIQELPCATRVTRHRIAYVPQRDNVFPTLSVAENLRIGGADLGRAERRERIELMVDLYPQLKRKLRAAAASLSGGERQMLAMARALMPDPRMLLLDEPSAGLSPLMTDQLFEAVAATRERTGAAFLIVEQNAQDSLSVSDRGYVLSLGRVAREGAATTLLDAPDIASLYLGTASEETVHSIGAPGPTQPTRRH